MSTDFLDAMKANAKPPRWRDVDVVREGTRGWWTRREQLAHALVEIALILRDLFLFPLLAVALGASGVVAIGALVGIGLRIVGLK